jgi:hypothetical protein
MLFKLAIILILIGLIIVIIAFIFAFCGLKPYPHIHKWKQSRPLYVNDIHPFAFEKYNNLTRTCKICNKTQEWLPGYRGSSELGHWLD